MDHIWNSISTNVYATQIPFNHLNFIDQGGLSSYYSPLVTKADAELISRFLQSINLSPINTRLFKLNATSFELRIASVYSLYEKLGTYTYNDTTVTNTTVTVKVSAQDYSPILHKVVAWLEEAEKVALNEVEAQMLAKYIEHFKYGE